MPMCGIKFEARGDVVVSIDSWREHPQKILCSKGLATLQKLLTVDVPAWLEEVPKIKEHFAKFGENLPAGLKQEIARLEERLQTAAK